MDTENKPQLCKAEGMGTGVDGMGTGAKGMGTGAKAWGLEQRAWGLAGQLYNKSTRHLWWKRECGEGGVPMGPNLVTFCTGSCVCKYARSAGPSKYCFSGVTVGRPGDCPCGGTSCVQKTHDELHSHPHMST